MNILLRPWAYLGIVLAVGLGLRLHGVSFGLPYLYDPDEWYFVVRAITIMATGDFNPHWFGHPGTVVIYLLTLLYSGIYVVGRVIGYFGGASDYAALYYADPTLFYLSGRLLMVLAAVVGIVLTYLAGRGAASARVGWMAAALVAASPLLVDLSQIVRTDIVATSLLLGASLTLLHGIADGSSRAFASTAFLAGLAVATKYPAIIFAVPMLVGMYIGAGRESLAKLVGLGGLWGFLGTFLGSPFLLLDMETALKDIAPEADPVHLSAIGGGFVSNLSWYLTEVLSGAVSWTAVALMLLGGIAAITRRNKGMIVFLSFVIAYLVFVSFLGQRWARWLVPAVPFVALLAAYGLEWLSDLRPLAARVGVRRALSLGLAAAILVPTLAATLQQTGARAWEDTRTLARERILSNIPAGSGILMEWYTPQLPRDRYRIFGARDGQAVQLPRPERKPNIFPEGSIGELESNPDWGAVGVEYVVESNMAERYRADSVFFPNEVHRYREIERDLTLIHELLPISGHRNGPPIRIYRVTPPEG